MYRRIFGENYDAKLETKEITALVKKQIKQKYKDIKVSCRTGSQGMIWITLKLDKDKYRAKEYKDLDDRDKRRVLHDLDVGCIDHSLDKISTYLNDVPYLNKEAMEIKEYSRNAVKSYSYDCSDPYTDYFDIGVCGNVNIEWI